LRDEIERFTSVGAQVVTVAPETADGVARFVRDNEYPFPLLADEDHVVSTMMSLGQRPALFVVNRDGIVQFDSIGVQQWQIPTNDNVIAVLATL
jgi:peroxiredoxin